jgi:hypothetical protein
MDCRLQARMKEMVEELAREHQRELAAAGTLVDLEELTCQIGDEFTRLLTEKELVRRGREHPHRPADCPDCGRNCLPDYEPEPTVLKGLRGELVYQQPKHFCDRCRRAFFPSGGAVGGATAEQRHDQGIAKSGLGGRQQRQLPHGGRGARRTG